MSKKLKLTPWFPSNVKPVRHGVYKCSGDPDWAGSFQYWNGKHWGGWATTVLNAEASRHIHSARHNPMWRGLAVKP